MLSDFKAGGQPWTDYIRLGGEVIGFTRGNQLYYVASDQLGRPELVTNGAKAEMWRANNYAFNRSLSANSIGEFNLGFPGQYYDVETGHWNNGFRDYDDDTGRYLQSDPIGLKAGVNTYAYVGGNPTNFADPYGLCVDYLGVVFGAADAVTGTAAAVAGAANFLIGAAIGSDSEMSLGAAGATLGLADAHDGVGAMMTSIDGIQRQSALEKGGGFLLGAQGASIGKGISSYLLPFSKGLGGIRKMIARQATGGDAYDAAKAVKDLNDAGKGSNPCSCGK